MSDLSSGIVTLLAVDFAFAALTGMTGVHGMIVDAGAQIGQALGITPFFGAESVIGADTIGGDFAADVSTSGEVVEMDTDHVDAHDGHDHPPGEHHAFNNSSGVRDLYPQQEYSLAA